MIEFSEEINRRFNIETVIPSRGESFILNAHNVIAIDEKVRPDNSSGYFRWLKSLKILKKKWKSCPIY